MRMRGPRCPFNATCLRSGYKALTVRTRAQVINKLDAEYDEEFLDREIMTMKKVTKDMLCAAVSLSVDTHLRVVSAGRQKAMPAVCGTRKCALTVHVKALLRQSMCVCAGVFVESMCVCVCACMMKMHVVSVCACVCMYDACGLSLPLSLPLFLPLSLPLSLPLYRI